MSTQKTEIEAVLKRAEETLQTAKHGLEDLLDSTRKRRMSGLRNLIVFGRSVTFVLQNIRSIIPEEFDRWYEPQQAALKSDPLMRYFIEARNELEKQGKLSVATSAHISFSTNDIKKFGPPPPGATAFFIGDSLGGTGWEVELANGTKEKYYVDLPASIGEVKQHFSNFPEAKAPELRGATVEELSRTYIERLSGLVAAAHEHFLGASAHHPPKTKQFPPHFSA